MTIFKAFDESLFREFRSSAKEGLDDIAADEEEIDKIEFEISESRAKVKLRVDFSNFANHIYFGSALAAVNFALSRLLNDYPIDGELKEKNEWRRVNSGYENFFFDEYPKQQGFFFTVTGSSTEAWVEVDDHEYKLRPETGSVAIDCVIDPYDNITESDDFKTLVSFWEPTDGDGGFWTYLSGAGDDKRLVFRIASGSTISELDMSYTASISGAHALSFVYDQPNQLQIIYLDGDFVVSKSLATDFPSGVDEILVSSRKLYVGAASSSARGGFGSYFTGGIDDVRFWAGPVRKPELIKRNFFRPTHANVSGGLKAYYKFNETDAVGINVVDYSSNEVHGVFSGAFSFASNVISGNLGSFFKDPGDPIFDLVNTRVTGFLDTQRASGSFFDKENRNFIFKIVPSFFIDEGDDHEDMQRFLLLMARHYDRLKLYIEHLANIHNVDQSEFNNTPDELIGLIARHYGLDLGSVYEGASALEYFFGENVNPTGSLECSIETIQNQLRRNLLSNLIYVIKTKSTREALEASLRALGLDEEIVNINEYSAFSGGITTSRTPRTVERRVVRFLTSSNVFLTSTVFSDTEIRAYEVRTLFDTGSIDLTSSVFTFASGAAGDPFFYLEVERENLTSANAVVKLHHSGATSTPLTSSLLSIFDNNWINFYADRDAVSGDWNLVVHKLFCGDIAVSSSATAEGDTLPTPGVDAITTASLGSKGGVPFEGHMQEFRAWDQRLATDLIQNHARDFESLAVANIADDIKDLLVHLKLNDFTGSDTGTVVAHDYVIGATGSTYSGLSSSAVFNFPGKYIDKLEPSYSYDFGINNDKIRIRDNNEFNIRDIIPDIPYLSVDMSPAISLNREIVRWFGDLEKFNNLIGKPFLRYRDDIDTLNDLRFSFFNQRLNSKINFQAYLNLLTWFDSNFTFFLGQLLPLDLGSSLSNFVVESHLLEHNQVPRIFPFKKGDSSLELIGTIDARTILNVALTGEDIPLGDPGRFGAAVSASAEVVTTEDVNLFTSASLSGTRGVNFQRADDRQIFTDFLRENSSSNAPPGYGNGWHTLIITGANYLKNVLNVDSSFHISGVHFLTGAVFGGDSDGSDSLYLTAAHGQPLNTHFTGAINGVQDSTWLWYHEHDAEVFDAIGPKWVYGIGYGGAWGQLPFFNKRGLRATTLDLKFNIGDRAAAADDLSVGLGGGITEDIAQQRFVKVIEETDDAKTHVLWPNIHAFEPVFIAATGSDGTNDTTGSIIPLNTSITMGRQTEVPKHADFWSQDFIRIEGFNHLDVAIRAKRIVAPTANDTPIRFIFQFQFFDKDLPGDNDVEGALSSSFNLSASSQGLGLVTSQYISKKIDHQFELEKVPPSTAVMHSFTTHFERELPKAKFMRVYVRVEYPNAFDNQTNVAYKVLIKGTLHKETTEVQQKLLNERRS